MSKVILITGASSGMGKTTAIDLIKQGHVVYGASRDVENMKELQELGAYILNMDVTKDEEIRSGVERIINEQGKIDVLWNNAGYGLYGSVEETSIDDARNQFEVNLFGLARLTQLVIPYMRKQKSGIIINTSSMGGKVYTPFGAWYHATKHALEGWSDCLRFELAPFGIKVVILEPGAIKTNWGNIMRRLLQERSSNGPYKEMVEATIKAGDDAYKKDNASDPSVISQTIQKIIVSDKPKTRYAVGKMAKPMIFIRKYFGDRVFDRVIKFYTRK
ncbi:short-chain dehydrogenase/reductase [Candidatus Parcubacteria bacterium]|nr:MAG: short-chain dehydrogenase/reductase [Candidatus Parcubacteria bacterium]